MTDLIPIFKIGDLGALLPEGSCKKCYEPRFVWAGEAAGWQRQHRRPHKGARHVQCGHRCHRQEAEAAEAAEEAEADKVMAEVLEDMKGLLEDDPITPEPVVSTPEPPAEEIPVTGVALPELPPLPERQYDHPYAPRELDPLGHYPPPGTEPQAPAERFSDLS